MLIFVVYLLLVLFVMLRGIWVVIWGGAYMYREGLLGVEKFFETTPLFS